MAWFRAMRWALPLLFVALVLTGCGRTYSVEETRAALAAEGIRTPDEANGISSLLYLGLNKTCSQEGRPFVALKLAIEQLQFDLGGVPQAEYTVPGGTVDVFCNRYDAVRLARVYTLIEQRGASYLRPFVTIRPRVVRNGNVVLVERNGPEPRLEAALARLH